MSSDRYELTMAVVDKATAPIGKAEAAVEKMVRAEKALDKASEEATRAVERTGEALAQTGHQAVHAAAGIERAAKAMEHVDRATAGRQRTLDRAARIRGMGLTAHRKELLSGSGGDSSGGAPTASALSRLWSWNKATGEGVQNWTDMADAFRMTPFGLVARGLGSVASSLFNIGLSVWDALFSVGKLGVGLGAIAAVGISAKAVEMAAFAESSKTAFKYATGSAEMGKTWMDKAVETAAYLGENVKETISQFRNMAAQKFDLGTADSMLRAAADLKQMTGNADATERIMAQVIKIQSQGKMQGDELMVMAESGLNVGLVYDALAKKLGKSKDEIAKMQQTGKITNAMFNEAFVSSVAAMTQTKNAGEFARDMSLTTLGGMWGRLKNMPDSLMLRVSQGIDTGPAKDALKSLTAALDGFEGDGMTKFVNVIIAQVPKATRFVLGFFDGFGKGFGGILDKLKFGDGEFRAWGERSGQAVVGFFGKVVDAAKWLADEGPKALTAFWDGLGLGELESKFETFDFKTLGEDLAVVAGAIGDIAHYTADMVRYIKPAFKVAEAASTVGGGVLNPLGLLKDALTNGGETWDKFADASRTFRDALTGDIMGPRESPREQTMTPAVPRLPSGNVSTEVHFFDHRTEVRQNVTPVNAPAQVSPMQGPASTGWWQ